MGAAGAELRDGFVRGAAHARSLGGHGHLVVHDAQHGRFQHLRLHQRCHNGDDGLVGEDNLPFPHGIDITGKAHGGEVLAKLLILFSRKEFGIKVLLFRAQRSYHFQHFFRAAHHGPVVILRRFAVKKVEDSYLLLLPAVQIGLSHGILVLVRNIGGVDLLHDGSGISLQI